MIRKRLVSIAVGCLCAATAPRARAADPSDWTGPYAGGTVGIASTTFMGPVTFPSLTTESGAQLPGATVSLDTGRRSSAFGGGQGGYTWIGRGLAAGVEGQVTGAMASGTVTLGAAAVFPFASRDTFTARSTWSSAMRARLGIARERWLLYGAAGMALTSVTVAGTFSTGGSAVPPVSGSDRHTATGATFGAGFERNLGRERLGVEYRYTRFGSQSFRLGNVAADSSATATEPIVGTVRASASEIAVRVMVPLGAN
jgi:opacity protein-like surface antigen